MQVELLIIYHIIIVVAYIAVINVHQKKNVFEMLYIYNMHIYNLSWNMYFIVPEIRHIQYGTFYITSNLRTVYKAKSKVKILSLNTFRYVLLRYD